MGALTYMYKYVQRESRNVYACGPKFETRNERFEIVIEWIDFGFWKYADDWVSRKVITLTIESCFIRRINA